MKVRIGEIGGHRIWLDLLAFGIFALFVITSTPAEASLKGPIAFLVAAFVSILVHELGHAAAIRRLTGQYTDIVLGFGGMTLSGGTSRAGAQLLISLAGPAAGFLLGALGWGVALWASPRHFGWPPWAFLVGDSVWFEFLRQLIYVSCVWGLLNLVPACPLDGGQALRALLILTGVSPFTARRYTRRLAVAIVILVAIWVLKFGGDTFFLFLGAWVFFANADEARSEGW